MVAMKRSLVFLVISLTLLLSTCAINDRNQDDLATWDEEKVFSYLNEVKQHVRNLPVETDSKEKIAEQYEVYFTPELSKKIVDSLYIQETDNGWKIPDSDGGYIFIVPNRESENSVVTIKYNNDSIKVKESYEHDTWIYTSIEYIIRYEDRPVITEWVQMN